MSVQRLLPERDGRAQRRTPLPDPGRHLARRLTGRVPRGVPAEDAPTDAEILAGRDDEFVGVTDPSGTLDGKPLDVESGFARTGVYTFAVEEGSFAKAVDPSFAESDEARAASAGWIVRIPPLSPGNHELVLSDKLDGEPFTATFHITIEPRRH